MKDATVSRSRVLADQRSLMMPIKYAFWIQFYKNPHVTHEHLLNECLLQSENEVSPTALEHWKPPEMVMSLATFLTEEIPLNDLFL
jgi:hypothetical protein